MTNPPALTKISTEKKMKDSREAFKTIRKIL